MKKIIIICILITFLTLSIAIANSNYHIEHNSKKYSLRGSVAKANIDKTPGNVEIKKASGSFSSYINTAKDQSQGKLEIQGFHANWEKFRFSLNWNWKGNYHIHTINDNKEKLVIDTYARVIKNREVEYWIPITITYYKCSKILDIDGPDFSFKNIYVKDLINENHRECEMPDEPEPQPPICEPQCQDKQCGDDGCGNSCGSCEFGFSCNLEGQCNPDVPEPEPELLHDVALVNFNNAINNIRLEHTNNSDILDSIAELQCNTQYKIGITIQNNGDVPENITYTGSIGPLNFNHLPTNNLLPEDTSLKTRTVNFTLAQGDYTIIVEAHIQNSDNTPADNMAQRDITILCEV